MRTLFSKLLPTIKMAGMCVLIPSSSAFSSNNIHDTVNLKTALSIGIETRTFYRNLHRRSSFPIMPIIPTIGLRKNINSGQSLVFSIGHSLPLNIAGEYKYAFLYHVYALFVNLGIEQRIFEKKQVSLALSLFSIGRIGSIRPNPNIMFFLPPPVEFDEAIPDKYRIDGFGLGLQATVSYLFAKKTGIMLQYGIDKYLVGVSINRYSFNEIISVKLFYTF